MSLAMPTDVFPITIHPRRLEALFGSTKHPDKKDSRVTPDIVDALTRQLSNTRDAHPGNSHRWRVVHEFACEEGDEQNQLTVFRARSSPHLFFVLGRVSDRQGHVRVSRDWRPLVNPHTAIQRRGVVKGRMQNVMKHDGLLGPTGAAGHVASLAFKSMASKLFDRGDPFKACFQNDTPRFLGEGDFTRDGFLRCKKGKDMFRIWRVSSTVGSSLYVRDGPKIAFSQKWESLVPPRYSVALPRSCRSADRLGYNKLLDDLKPHILRASDRQTIFLIPAAELRSFTYNSSIIPKQFTVELHNITYLMTTITSRSDQSNKFYIKAKKSKKGKVVGKHAISMHGYLHICRAWDPLIDEKSTARLPDSTASFVNQLVLTNFHDYDHLRHVIFLFSMLGLKAEEILDCTVKSIEWRKEQDIFRHEYLVFELTYKESQNSAQRTFFLRTERNTRTYKEAFFTGEPTDHISGLCIEADRAGEAKDDKVVVVKSPASQVAMKDVVQIIRGVTESSPKYKLWSTMCWWFARTCMAKLADRFTQDDSVDIQLVTPIRGRQELTGPAFHKGKLELKRLKDYCRTPIAPKGPLHVMEDGTSRKIRMYTNLSNNIWALFTNLGSWVLEVCIPDVVWNSFGRGFRGLKELRKCLEDIANHGIEAMADIARGEAVELMASLWRKLGLVTPLANKELLARRNLYPESFPFGQTQQVVLQ